MHPTRRLWAIAGLAAFLAVLAAVLDQPLLLAGTVLIGAWLLSRQYLFYRAVTAVVENSTITQMPAKEWAHTDDVVPVTLTARLDEPSNLVCTLRAGLPPAATITVDASPETTLEAGMTATELTVDVSWPVAGRHEFRQATLTVRDGLFEQTLPVGPTPAVTVEPRGPRETHVGEGGEQVSFAYGKHDAGRLGSGIEPADLREYVAGDTVNRIDWNATARLDAPYVREYEAETDQQTLLVVDHRNSLAEGPPEETKLEFLREVALVIAERASRLDDPLGLLTVGDGGITTRFDPATTHDHYATVRRTLLRLEPTAEAEPADSAETSNDTLSRVTETRQTMRDVRRTLATLEAGDDSFARTLRPFYADRQHYHQRLGDDPLFDAVRMTLDRQPGQLLTVLCTDDSRPVELRETVTIAAEKSGRVLVLLAPSVLYEMGGLSDIERGYERYVAFENLRRDLAKINGVTALEVGPGDRLSAILAAGRSQRIRQPVGGGSR